jgi:hypothetical protein
LTHKHLLYMFISKKNKAFSLKKHVFDFYEGTFMIQYFLFFADSDNLPGDSIGLGKEEKNSVQLNLALRRKSP